VSEYEKEKGGQKREEKGKKRLPWLGSVVQILPDLATAAAMAFADAGAPLERA
jgi:hypothetical protein